MHVSRAWHRINQRNCIQVIHSYMFFVNTSGVLSYVTQFVLHIMYNWFEKINSCLHAWKHFYATNIVIYLNRVKTIVYFCISTNITVASLRSELVWTKAMLPAFESTMNLLFFFSRCHKILGTPWKWGPPVPIFIGETGTPVMKIGTPPCLVY